MRKVASVVLFLILLGGGIVYAQLSCGFIIDLSSPYVDSLYPANGDTVSTSITFGGAIGDSGAGVWTDYATSLSMWPTCPSAATYIYWAVGTGSFADTIWGATSAMQTFNPGDTVHACIHAIDHIEDYGCSCCPNELDTCWTFYILTCDSFWAENTCPDTCGIITSCDSQSMDITLHPYGTPVSFIGSSDIVVEVLVNSITVGTGTVDVLPWAILTDDSFLTVLPPPPGHWNHGDTVEIMVYSTTDCPKLDTFICSFVVDTVPPILASFAPADGETLTSAVVNITGNLTDDFAGVASGSTNVTVTIYDSLGMLDTTLLFDSLSATFNIGYNFNSGDSVSVCVHAVDDVYLQPGCTCPPNAMDSCWWFIILVSEPYGWVVVPIDSNMDGRVISTCDDQNIIVRVYDSHGMTTSPIRLWVEGTAYTDADAAISTALYGAANETLEVSFDPTAAGITWTDGMWVHFSLDSALNTLGFNIVDAVTDSFLIDLEPPVVSWLAGPGDGDVISADNAAGSAVAYDSVCGDVPVDSIRVTTTLSGIDQLFTGDTYSVIGLVDGDSVTVCAYAHDECEDYTCLDTSGVHCWTFTVLMGAVSAELLVPIDSTGDGRIISTCDDQQIWWLIDHPVAPLDSSTISVRVCGTTYLFPDHLTFSGDTLIFTPSPLWSDLDSCGFCLLTVEDTLGGALADSVCGWVLIDLSPPTFTLESGTPIDGDTINVPGTIIDVSSIDAVCGSVAVDSMRITTTISGLDIFADSGYIDLSGLVNGDTVTVCAYSQDGCEDYCLSNVGDSCWTFYVVMGAVSASLIDPYDINGDGRVISTCDNQQIVWVIDHSQPLVLPSIQVEVCGISYTYPDHLTFSNDTLYFDPSPLWSDGDSCGFCIVAAEDSTGGTLADTVCGWVLIDLSPPYLVASSPTDGATIYTSDAHITASFGDSICPDTLDFVDTCWAEAYNLGVPTGTAIGGYDFPLDISGLADGDSVAVCAIVSDGCEDYCEANVDTLCWFFDVLMGEPWGEWISPPDTNLDNRRITTCDDECFVIYVHDSHGMDTTYYHLTVNGVDFTYGSSEVTLWYEGDSTTMGLRWCPDTLWNDGAWINVVLDSALNIIGDPLVDPVVDSFLVDLSPPTFTYIGPWGITVTDTPITISASASDAICGGGVVLDSLVIDALPSGFHENWDGIWSGDIHGLADGDSVTICDYAHDICSDTCGANYGDSCWTFDVALGAISASLIIPVDSTGDGRVISACDDQQIWWLIEHEYPLIMDSLVVEVCGSLYYWGDAELSMVDDTLIWTPPAGYWSDEDSCGFALVNICDNTGVCLPSPVSGDVIIDLSPPVFSGEFPSAGSVVLDSSTNVYILASDVICPDAIYDSLVISTSLSGSSWVFMDTLGANIGGFVNGDNVYVCAYAHDDCHDYCGPLYSDTCWSFDVALGAVQAGIVQPIDLNGDGCIESSCPCQPIEWWITSEHWFDTLSIDAVIDGMTFDWSSGAFSLTTITADSALLTFDPALAGTCWSENCYVIDFALTHLLDTLGTDSLEYSSSGSFVMLSEAPTITYSPEPPGTTECLDTLVVDVSVDHGCACSIENSMTVTIDGTAIFTWDSVGLVELPVISGDTVCISVSGLVDHDYICDSLLFSNDTCWYIQCPCDLAIDAGPDQNSCPGADVILGCNPLITGTFDSTYTEWFLAGESTPFITTDNPLAYPDTTTMYIVRVVAFCPGGDSIVEYDTTNVFIDFEPVTVPSIADPLDGTQLTAGTHDIIWNTSSGTPSIYYDVLVDGISLVDSLTDTFATFDINCEDTLHLVVVAYNQCSYMLDAGCNSSIDSTIQTTAAVYETSAVVTVWGEPCGGPVGTITFPPESTITACEDQNITVNVLDPASVDLVPDSFVVHIQSQQAGLGDYDTSETFITYTATTASSGEIEILPPYGSSEWFDNDTITIWVTDIYNTFGISGVSDTSIFFTDYSPPYALMVDPLNSSDVSDRTPEIQIEISDAVSGVNPDSLVLEISTNGGRIDTLLESIDGALHWDGTNLVFDCDSAGIEFMAGETVNVEMVMTCDSPDSGFCEPNCSTYTYWFYYPLIYECLRIPNPFTPNSDGKNDYCQFTFPELSNKDGTIYIYDIYNVLVRKIEVPAGSPKDVARWYGYDDSGNKLKQGLYLYAIEVENEIVCNGTVTIAR